MIKSFFYKFYIKKSNFSKALTYKNDSDINMNSWCYYRLGMYETVIHSKYNNLNIFDLLAKAISHATCAQYDKANSFINIILENKKYHKHLIFLADAISPYMPKQALEILGYVSASKILHGAILLKLGETKNAKEVLTSAIKSKEYRVKPEVYLYYSNTLSKFEIKRKLTLLNKFLLYYNLSKVRNIDKTGFLTPQNIEVRTKSKSVRGPLVSVLMTTFEAASRLDIAIESILNQSYKDIELFVVDDASSDDTSSRIQKWIEKDSRIKFIKLEKNVGTYVAKNIALLKASGEFITCHDSDDWSHPRKLEFQILPLLKNKKLIATTSSWIRIDDDGFYYARSVHPLMRINPSSLLFRKKEVLKYAGIWDSVRTGADSEFLARLRLVFGKKAIKKINKPLAFGSHRKDSLMNDSSTGYCSLGLSPTRLSYWEAWNNWHINELRKNKKPFMGNMLEKRKFIAPDKIIVPINDIKKILDVLKI